MLKRLGNIFKGELPSTNTAATRIPITGNTSVNRILSNYTRYENNTNIFRTFIQIDTTKATELGLSYFKTITINKFDNSKYSNLRLGYTNLLNEQQKVDLKNFISKEDFDKNFSLIRSDILGRELNLNSFHNKFSVENFASRKAYNYNSGLAVTRDLSINEYQELFFELAYSTTKLEENLSQTQYDLIIYAMNSNDEIIDVKKIENFNTANVIWVVNTTTRLYDIDDVDFDKLFNITFDSAAFNNLRRKFYVNITQYCKQIKNDLRFYPIETISIQENSSPIEIELDRIDVQNAFMSSDKIELNCNADLTLLTPPVTINYKLFMKIAGRNSYVIKTFQNTITDPSALTLVSQQQKFVNLLGHTTVQYLTNVDQLRSTIKVNLLLQRAAYEDQNFNPRISSIFINNDSKDYASQAFTFAPAHDSFPNLNLQGNLLKDIVTNSEYIGVNSLIFYLRNTELNPLNLKIVFEQNFERYEMIVPIETVYETSDYEQRLTITDNNAVTKDFSNLNIEYLIKIKNFKNSSNNLNRFLTLNYENIFLQELQQGKEQLSQDFENNIFVIVKKSIYQESIHVKDKYYIFNKDIRNFNMELQLNTENDLNLKLKFIDDFQTNNFFFTNIKNYDNLDLTKNVQYKFEARIMIIPIGFFIVNSDYITKQRIKELLSLNNFKKPLASSNKVEEIFQILKKINDNSFADLNQLYLHKLYQEFCLKDTQANNEISIAATTLNLLENSNLNKLSFNSISYSLIPAIERQKKLRLSLNFEFLLKNSDNTKIVTILNKLQSISILNSFFFKHNNSYINISSQVITELSSSLLRQSLNRGLQYTFNINANSLEIVLILEFNSDLNRFFNLAYTRSKLEFSPYSFDFLDRNLYLRLDLPVNLSEGDESIEFFNISENDSQYCLLDFYQFLN